MHTKIDFVTVPYLYLMKPTIFTLAILLVVNSLFAQSKVYFDKREYPLNNKKGAEYYRIVYYTLPLTFKLQ